MNLIHIQDLTRQQIEDLLARASEFARQAPGPVLSGKKAAFLFCEPSTRTRCSFEIAARNLGADVIHLPLAESSAQKGEDLLDTVKNLQAMGVNFFIIRHARAGTAEILAKTVSAQVINAGEGTQSHPSQALLDMLTIQQHKPDFARLSVAIVGDIRHSRVAHSDIAALQILGVKDIRLIGPADFLPPAAPADCELLTDLEAGLADVDVVITLRIQKERMERAEIPDSAAYFNQYGLTQTRLQRARPDAIVMHPGPMNRGVEIASDVADGPQSVILRQVRNGVYIRMAILAA